MNRVHWNGNFGARLREGLETEGRLVFLGCFEVETHWTDEGTVFPRGPALGNSSHVVNRMEELGLLLAEPTDIVVLKEEPDAGFLAYLESLGWAMPRILWPEVNHPELNVTQNVLRCPRTMTRLRELGREGARLMPFGTSHWEETLSRETGLPLATPSAEVCRRVNSKIYSRRMTEDLGLRMVPGACCESLADVARAMETLGRDHLDRGEKLVVKEAMGVSGKGQVVLQSRAEFERFYRLLERMARQKGTERVGFVVEKWISKRTEFNYQFLVRRDGSVDYHFLKESLVRNGVHQGHQLPGSISGEEEYRAMEAARLLAPGLARDGYVGIVGVDGMIDTDGTLYPVLEINARFNMSTYLSRLHSRFIDESRWAVVKKYPIRSSRSLSFAELESRLDGALYSANERRGFLVTCFATVNAAAGGGEGRLYGAIIATSPDEAAELDSMIEGRLRDIFASKADRGAA